MALAIKDRVKETSTTTGTGTYTLAGAVTGFETFGSVGDGNTTYYCCTDNTNFEVGIGTYTSSGTTLDRTTILQSSNSDSAVNWSSGTRTIFCTYPADKAVFKDASNNINGTFVGNITGNVTGNTSGTAATVTTAAQSNITSLGTLTTLTVDNVIINGTTIGHTSDTDLITLADGVATVAGELDASSLDISGDADIDGTLEADAYTVDGTALNEYIADTVGAMVGSNTETGITVSYEDGDNTLDFVIGTLNQDTTGTADNITISANNSANETVYPIFVDGATGSQGAESDTGLTYNPSTGMLTSTGVTSTFTGNITGNVTGNASGTAATVTGAAQSNITSLGTLTTLTVDNVIINGATIGHTGDTDLMTVASGVLTVAGEVDATSLDVSGDADIDGTLEADAITVDGTALNEYIADTVGAMVTSNTESGITVAYQDGDNTLDFTVGTLNQDTTGTASLAVVTDSTANTNFPVVFHNESNALLDDTGALRYNPSTGTLLVPNLSVAGTTTTVDTVTMQAANAVIFEGATADAHETTLSIVDPTGDHTQYLINQGGYMPVLAAATTTAITSTPAELNILDGVTSTAAELNILDGVTSTAAEINLIDGGTARGTTSVASGDGLLVNDGGTMRMTNVDTVSTYFSSHNVGGSNIVTTGALDSGSITSGFGTIDTGSSTITTTGLISGGSLDIDDVLINGTTIGHTDDTDLITLTDGVVTVAGELDATTLDISGNADIDGTLEADAITVDGTTLAEYIADTAGGMFSSNTETGITVTYQDADNTVDVAIDAAQTTITSIYATDLILGEDAQTAIDFGTANEIDFKVDNAARLTLTASALYPVTDNQIDLGTSSLEFKDAFFDGTVTTDAISNWNLNNAGYFWLTTDAQYLYFGANYEVTLRHVHNTGLLLNGAMQLQFGDSGTYIHQSADGVLDLVSDTEIEINATTIDMNGALDVSGAITSGGVITGTGFTIGSAVIAEAELEMIDGITAGTVAASKAVVVDANKDAASFRNITLTGELDAATGDFSGDVDIDGTLEADAITVNGSTLASVIADEATALSIALG